MSKNDIAVLRIESISATGSGLACADGRRFYTDFSASGDYVKVRISEEQKNWSKCEILEILEPSADRVKPVCPSYGICGGCNLQHINYQAQLTAKKDILAECFNRTGGFSPPEIKIRLSSPWEYRNRVQFHCMPGNRKIPGFMERKGKTIIPVRDCVIADPGIREALKTGNDSRLLPPPEKDRYNIYSKNGVFLTEGGETRGLINLYGRTLSIDAGVFFQSNGAMLEKLLEDLIALAKKCDPGSLLGDIYCGVGTFSAFLSDYFYGTELVEENKTALALAKENAGGKNRQFYSMRADDWIKRRKYNVKPFGMMIADPPRTGLTPAMRKFAAGTETEIFAYVSCDPASLARDSRDLVEAGLILTELCMYDFYPQTSHIESLAVFTKGKICE